MGVALTNLPVAISLGIGMTPTPASTISARFARKGLRTVDSNSQLRHTGRFRMLVHEDFFRKERLALPSLAAGASPR
jgi:hypothetical protein